MLGLCNINETQAVLLWGMLPQEGLGLGGSVSKICAEALVLGQIP